MSDPTIAGTGLRLLPKDFTPSINEVIIGRGRKVVNHSGNQRFQDLIHSHLSEYSKAKTKTSKSAIIRRVLLEVKEGSAEGVGGFVKQDASTKRWYAMEEASARISTAQAFRDALSGSYRSSRQYKQQRRWNMRTPGSNDTEAVEEVKETEPAPPKKLEPVRSISAFPAAAAPPAQGIAGLRGILSSALDLMDDSMFDDDLGSTPVPNASFAPMVPAPAAVEDDLTSLLARYESQVEITANPFEPTPIKSSGTTTATRSMPPQYQPKSFSLFQKNFSPVYQEYAKAAPASNNGGSMSLRNVMSL